MSEKLTEAVFSMQCSFIAKNAAAWAGDILTLPENYNHESDARTVARFTDEMRSRLKRLDDWVGRQSSIGEWSSISTAPQDGREILITTEGVGSLVRIGFWDDPKGGCWSVWPGRAVMVPTHWMPLPTPPKPSLQSPPTL